MTSGPDRQGPAAGEALVLCYHAVSSDWDAELAVTPAGLAAQLELLLRRGYRGVTFSDAAAGRGGSRALAVTFDDGYRSVLDSARPILARLGIPGTVFVVTDLVGGGAMSWPGIDRWIGSAHEPELVPMSWPELRSLAAEGWEIGSHTRTHPRLTSLDDESLDDELRTSRGVCSEEVGVECNALAYPYGADDERVAEAARGAGYGVAASLPSRLTGSTLRWPRIGIYRRDTLPRFRLKVAPAMRRLRSGAAWAILERARRGPSGSRPGGGAS
jgi:peptidoglycan/xylan/chitin deacetylase (PgdA/CDA1 family)